MSGIDPNRLNSSSSQSPIPSTSNPKGLEGTFLPIAQEAFDDLNEQGRVHFPAGRVSLGSPTGTTEIQHVASKAAGFRNRNLRKVQGDLERLQDPILSEQERFGIVKTLIEEGFFKQLKGFENLKLPKSGYLELAKALLNTSPRELISSLSRFNLSPQELSEIAKSLTLREPRLLVAHLKKFHLSKEETLDIVRTLNKHTPWILFQGHGLNKFITKEIGYLDLAKAMLESRPFEFFKNRESFELTKAENLEIALYTADTNPSFLFDNAACFRLDKHQIKRIIDRLIKNDPTALFAHTEPCNVVTNIEKLELDTEESSYAAEGIARKVPDLLLENLSFFYLDKNGYLTIAKALNKENAPKLAKILAKSQPDFLLENLNLFKLENIDLLEIAKILGKNGTFELAKELLTKGSKEALSYLADKIENFKLNDNEFLEIAKGLVAASPRDFLYNQWKFKPRLGEKEFLEINRTLLKQSPYHLLRSRLYQRNRNLIDQAIPHGALESYFDKVGSLQVSEDEFPELLKILGALSQEEIHFNIKTVITFNLLSIAAIDNIKTITKKPELINEIYGKIHTPPSVFPPELLLYWDPTKAAPTALQISFLDALAQEIQSKDNPHEKAVFSRWLGCSALCARRYNVQNLSPTEESILRQIGAVRSPNLKLILSKQLFSVLGSENFRSRLFSKTFSNKRYGKIFQMLLVGLQKEFLELEEAEETLEDLSKCLSYDFYQDVNRARGFVSCLVALLEENALSKEEKLNLLKVAIPQKKLRELNSDEKDLNELKQSETMSKKEKKQTLDALGGKINQDKKSVCKHLNACLQNIDILINMGLIENVRTISSATQLESVVRANFIRVDVEDFQEKFANTFAQMRDLTAIYTYAGKMDTLPDPEREFMKASLKVFVEEVLNGTLSEFRYREEGSDHLSRVFQGRADLKKRWMLGGEEDLNTLVSKGTISSSKAADFDMQGFLYDRVCKWNHISQDRIPYLYEGVRNPTQIKYILSRINSEGVEDEKTLANLQLQQHILQILQEDPKKRSELFDTVITADLLDKAFPESCQFKTDLADLGKNLRAQKQEAKTSFMGWKVVDTDNWQDLFLCGTEVIGSCQNVNSDSYTNKCLLGYVLDGKNRLVAVKNDKGEIVARVIFRVLLDERGNPVLFREGIYERPGLDPVVTAALDHMFARREKALGLELFSQKTCDRTLFSYDSKAPFEYADSASIGITNGEYSV